MSLKNLSVENKIPKKLKEKLFNKRIKKIYKKFQNSFNIEDNYIVAISGGPDSLALAFLTKIYSIKNNLRSRYFIVDHKLRKESAKEAKSVKKILKRFSINVEILRWLGKKPIKNIQSLARKKRYELLFSQCKKLNIKNIVLGHHSDDAIENFFIRMLRGSGLKGLVSLDKKTKINNFTLLIPLLGFNKEDLKYLSKKVFNFYVEDPSNKDIKFKRIKIRNLLTELEQNGLDKKKFLLTLNNLKYSDEVISFYVDKNLKENTYYNKKKNVLVINNNFFDNPYEIILRSLSIVIKTVGMKEYPARGKKIDNIIRKITNNTLAVETLGGCIIKKVNRTIILEKEHQNDTC